MPVRPRRLVGALRLSYPTQQQRHTRFSSSSSSSSSYPFARIESEWQAYWASHNTFRTRALDELDRDIPKYYVLDMFPYPSGEGLHVGHPVGYTATDIVARFKRMQGSNVLHPMGWDAFGLPAEQHAIDTGTHPGLRTLENIGRFREQLQRLGYSYDWDRELSTTDPAYYRWTQWIFLQVGGRPNGSVVACSRSDWDLAATRGVRVLVTTMKGDETAGGGAAAAARAGVPVLRPGELVPGAADRACQRGGDGRWAFGAGRSPRRTGATGLVNSSSGGPC
jgi:hypothetical protein